MARGRTNVRSWCVSLFMGMLSGCGGGGESSIDPFWIEAGIAAADVDSNGRNDVVTVATLYRSFADSDGYVTVYRQLTSGSFTADQYIVGRYLWKLEVADIDGDGRRDLVVLDVVGGSSANNDVLYLSLQDPANPGRFLAPRAIASGLATYDFTIADINRDGAPDIVVPGGPGGGDGAQFLMQSAGQRGTFQPLTTLALPGRATQVSSGDLNGDGLVDLVFYATTSFNVNTGSSGHVVLVYAQSAGGYTPPIALAPQVGVNAELLRIADVDGNELRDPMVLFNPFSTSYHSKLTVLLQTARGSYSAVDTSLASLRGTNDFVVSDLTGDGRPEVAVTGFFPTGSQVSSHTSVLVHAGSGAYTVAATYAMPSAMSRINAGDMDWDGLNDLVLLGDDNRAYMLLQSRASPGTFLAPRAL